jgi:hypothetical protein
VIPFGDKKRIFNFKTRAELSTTNLI